MIEDNGTSPPGAGKRYLSRLGGRSGARMADGLEAVGVGGPDLSADRRKTSLAMLERSLRLNVVEDETTPHGMNEIAAFLSAADRAMGKLAVVGDGATFTRHEEQALEAVIETDGSRPSLLIRADRVDPADPRIGDWQSAASMFANEIAVAARATGRVVVNGGLSPSSVAGTAWMIAPGLAATAKHVVEQTLKRHQGPDGDQWLPPFNTKITLDFHVEADAPARPDDRIEVLGTRWASMDAIGFELKLANLDLAVLHLAEEGPPPLTLARTLDVFPPGPPQIHVIGHPKEPLGFRDTSRDVFEQIRESVFGHTFGVKRWSPGEIEIGPGSINDDVNAHVLRHDASTLAGNSGSPMLDLVSFGDRAIGLHYGGFFKDENYAHPTAALHPHVSGLAPPLPTFV